jgi:hypothetical protein
LSKRGHGAWGIEKKEIRGQRIAGTRHYALGTEKRFETRNWREEATFWAFEF